MSCPKKLLAQVLFILSFVMNLIWEMSIMLSHFSPFFGYLVYYLNECIVALVMVYSSKQKMFYMDITWGLSSSHLFSLINFQFMVCSFLIQVYLCIFSLCLLHLFLKACIIWN